MDEKQAKSLLSHLERVLGEGVFTDETLEYFTLYDHIRSILKSEGLESLRVYLRENADLEYREGYVNNVPFSEIYDILFGDISFTPVHLNKYHTLCAWRLAQTKGGLEIKTPSPDDPV
jgi:hypothetical protein